MQSKKHHWSLVQDRCYHHHHRGARSVARSPNARGVSFPGGEAAPTFSVARVGLASIPKHCAILQTVANYMGKNQKASPAEVNRKKQTICNGRILHDHNPWIHIPPSELWAETMNRNATHGISIQYSVKFFRVYYVWMQCMLCAACTNFVLQSQLRWPLCSCSPRLGMCRLMWRWMWKSGCASDISECMKVCFQAQSILQRRW